jgi:hypothetical protein
VHTVLPFILFGIGIDNCFVVVTSFALSDKTLPLPERIGSSLAVSGGSITVPNSTFAAGDVVVVYNNHSAAITITLSTTNAYIAGTNTNKTSVSLATRGVCNILFISSTVAILTGNIS